MVDNNVKITVTVNDNGAVNTINNVERAERQLTETNKSLGLSFIEANQAAELLIKGLDVGRAVISATFDALDRAQAVENVTTAFGNLQNRIGELADDKLVGLRNATKGLISDFELMQQANTAVLLGVDDGSGKFTTLAEKAVKLGEAMGIDATKAIESLTTGIGRQSKLMLDNLGILVDTDKAYQRFAESNNLVVSELTDAQKKLAFQKDVVRAIEEATADLSERNETAASTATQLGTTIENLKDQFVVAFSSNEDLNTALGVLKERLGEIDVETLAQGLARVGQIIFDLASAFVDFYNIFVDGWKEITKLVTDNAIIRGLDNIKQSFLGFGQYMDNLRDQGLALIGISREGTTAGEQLAGALTSVTGAIAAPTLATSELPKVISELTTSFDTLSKTAENASKKVNSSVKKIGSSTKDPTKNLGIFGPGNAGGEAEFRRQIQAQQDRINQMIANGIGILFSGGSLKQKGGALGGLLGGSFASDIFGDQFGAIGDFFGNSLGSALGKGVGDAIGHVFGGNRDLDHKARNSVEDFFKKAFDANSVRLIIDGELSKINGISFDSFKDGGESVFGAFRELPQEAQSAFSGVGQALNAFLGTSRDIGGQIAATLADSVGGSLNNLQILIGATGVSLEQLKESVIDAFLNAELSAGEAFNALSKLELVFTKGIPDGVGLTSQAFDNLVASAGTGREAFDALGDIGTEAIEANISSLQDLRENLIAQGKPLDKVNTLFDSLGEIGIGTLDQLANVSAEQAIQALATLENKGFDFAGSLEKAANSASVLDDKLSKLDGKNVDINVNYRVKTFGDAPPPGANVGLPQ